MPALRPDIDPDGLLEYSVVFTDRSLNHMSQAFQGVMRDIHATLCEVYNAERAVVVPGGGTYAMEAVARQVATGEKVMVIRNGFFSYRWTQIFEAGSIPASETVMKARRIGNGGADQPFAPAPVDEVVAAIRAERPAVVFAPHVETASGMILPDDYIRAVADAVHEVGGLFVLDCIASGCIWVDMVATGVDILISAPQKGWSAPPSAGLVMMNAAALERCRARQSTSFAIDLAKWNSIMEAYLNGGHAYHATMPTDALRTFHKAMMETKQIGFETLRAAQWEQGNAVRAMLAERGVRSVAADGFAAPGVVVVFTEDAAMQTGKPFAALGLQVAGGVPLMVDEGPDYRSFRIGLFGLDKLKDVPASLKRLETAFDQLF
ncbi:MULTISPECIES: alanine--glyoxylate aminotransferase family protein [unclassified Sphingobium]|uniref:alanine--glyoxylate aminotransferase family protein n=1 Tax=unclassified Sphingobium TaxID=2611147 RepID=UPI002225960C|nr:MULTISPECIES: alanine--glyoxylate aminotransferase family protein [unclassified Sphingobium]MCW2396704.1 aspartate aminotransferase-like enzyme [Sphingobium sp. B8D3B]MCW2420221.1 aspartate aminotransferase-like enzyme [Sphingobium sp. B8D3C]